MTVKEFLRSIWVPSNNFDAASAHFAWGALIVLVFWLFLNLDWAVLLLQAWCWPKEMVVDVWLEADTFRDGFFDVIGYELGGILACLLIYWKAYRDRRWLVPPGSGGRTAL